MAEKQEEEKFEFGGFTIPSEILGMIKQEIKDAAKEAAGEVVGKEIANLRNEFVDAFKEINKSIDTTIRRAQNELASGAEKELQRRLSTKGIGGMGGGNTDLVALLTAAAPLFRPDTTTQLKELLATAQLLSGLQMAPFMSGMNFAAAIFGTSIKGGATPEGASAGITQIATEVQKTFSSLAPSGK